MPAWWGRPVVVVTKTQEFPNGERGLGECATHHHQRSICHRRGCQGLAREANWTSARWRRPHKHSSKPQLLKVRFRAPQRGTWSRLRQRTWSPGRSHLQQELLVLVTISALQQLNQSQNPQCGPPAFQRCGCEKLRLCTPYPPPCNPRRRTTLSRAEWLGSTPATRRGDRR